MIVSTPPLANTRAPEQTEILDLLPIISLDIKPCRKPTPVYAPVDGPRDGVNGYTGLCPVWPGEHRHRGCKEAKCEGHADCFDTKIMNALALMPYRLVIMYA